MHQLSLCFCIMVMLVACKTQKTADNKDQSTSTTIRSIDEQLSSTLIDKDDYFVEGGREHANPMGPTVITRNIHQDRNGKMWFASYQGLISYDGKIYTNHTNKDGLRRYRIFCLLEDKKGNMMFGTQGAGVFIYDGKTYKNITTADGLINDKIGWMGQVKNGDIWIGTLEGISIYNGKTFTNHVIPGDPNNNDINGIVEDNEGKIWVASRGNVSTWDGKKWATFQPQDFGPLTNTRSLMMDRNGNVWLGGQTGLYKHDGKTTSKIYGDFVGNLYLDSNDDIYFCASGDKKFKMALFRYEPSTGTIGLIKQEPSQIFGIIRANDGKLWYGTDRGIGTI
jgi:ligand-binding sensor domain-containing protein